VLISAKTCRYPSNEKKEIHMIARNSICRLALCIAMFTPSAAWAGHPMITDDAGTQGQGHFQLEVNGQYDHDQGAGITTTGGQAAAALTYGITDTIDVVAGIPYLWITEESNHLSSSENGISDATLDIKIRFYEHDGLSFAVKPGLSFPTGDNDKGLGDGKTGYHLYLIGTQETGQWTFVANLGYIRHETDDDTAVNDIWHVSIGAIYALDDQWKIVADAVAERNTDSNGDNDPVHALAGVIYSPTKNIDLDLGIKAGITSSATDWSLMAGTTFKF
jgi:hypothetical protein